MKREAHLVSSSVHSMFICSLFSPCSSLLVSIAPAGCGQLRSVESMYVCPRAGCVPEKTRIPTPLRGLTGVMGAQALFGKLARAALSCRRLQRKWQRIDETIQIRALKLFRNYKIIIILYFKK